VISKTFASQSRLRILHLRNQLVDTRKGDRSVTLYFSTMRRYVDEMTAAGKPLDDDDVVSYIFNGLDADYNSLIEHVNDMTDLISPKALYSRLHDTEAYLTSKRRNRKSRSNTSWLLMLLPVAVVAMVANSSFVALVTATGALRVDREIVVATIVAMGVVVSPGTLTIPIETISVRFVGNLSTPLSVAGKGLTRTTLALTRWHTRQLPHIILTQHGMRTVLPQITSQVISTSSP
jgi:hypothetical protein